jgi:flagellum-specific ATP synthase
MKALAEQIGDLDAVQIYGRVVGVRGLMIEVAGPIHAMSVGARLNIETAPGRSIACEVVGFSGGYALAMPFAALDSVRRGCRHGRRERPTARRMARPCGECAGRADRRPWPTAAGACSLFLPLIATACACAPARGRPARSWRARAQYIRHMLPRSMLARNVAADVSVIGLVGERGCEVQEFLQDDLGPAGLARSVVVVSTSDEPALMRRQAAYLTLAIAEFFRDHKDVLVLMDSVTRFGMAQREIASRQASRRPAKGIRRLFSPNCRACWSGQSGQGRAPMRAPSPACSRFCSTATITMSPWPTPCAAFSTVTL